MNSTTPSDLVRQITGHYIADAPAPGTPLIEWVQAECRSGCFKTAIAECVKKQPEPLRADLVIVEKIETNKITLKIPASLTDHESSSAFAVEVMFELNPATACISRL